MWTSYATNKITQATIQNCFHHAGYPTECTPTDDTNQDRLNQLIQQTSQALDLQEPLTADDYLESDHGAPATETLDDDWEEQLIASYTKSSDTKKDDEEESGTEPGQQPTTEPLLIKSMSEALKWATQLKNEAKLVDKAAEMEHDTTDLIVKGHQKNDFFKLE